MRTSAHSHLQMLNATFWGCELLLFPHHVFLKNQKNVSSPLFHDTVRVVRTIFLSYYYFHCGAREKRFFFVVYILLLSIVLVCRSSVTRIVCNRVIGYRYSRAHTLKNQGVKSMFLQKRAGIAPHG